MRWRLSQRAMHAIARVTGTGGAPRFDAGRLTRHPDSMREDSMNEDESLRAAIHQEVELDAERLPALRVRLSSSRFLRSPNKLGGRKYPMDAKWA